MSKMNRFLSGFRHLLIHCDSLRLLRLALTLLRRRSPQNLNLSQRVKFKRLPHELSKKQEERMQRLSGRKPRKATSGFAIAYSLTLLANSLDFVGCERSRLTDIAEEELQ